MQFTAIRIAEKQRAEGRRGPGPPGILTIHVQGKGFPEDLGRSAPRRNGSPGVWGIDLGVWGIDLGVWGIDLGVWGIDLGVWGIDLGVWGIDLGVWGIDLGVWGIDLGVWGIDPSRLNMGDSLLIGSTQGVCFSHLDLATTPNPTKHHDVHDCSIGLRSEVCEVWRSMTSETVERAQQSAL